MSEYFLNHYRVFSAIAPGIALPPTSLWSNSGDDAYISPAFTTGFYVNFQTRSIPTLMIFRENVIIFSQAGAVPEGALRDVVTKAGDLDMVEVHKQVAEQQAKNAEQAPPA